PFKPRASSTDSPQCVGITVPHLCPAVDHAIDTHGNLIRSNATKTGIPGLNAIEPDIIIRVNAVQYFTLAAMAEDGIERMGHYRQSTLLMNKLNGTLHAQPARNTLLNEESQHMALFRADLFAY